MSKKIICIFMVLAMFSFMGCLNCNGFTKSIELATPEVAPGVTAEFETVFKNINDTICAEKCNTFCQNRGGCLKSNPGPFASNCLNDAFSVTAKNPLTNFTLFFEDGSKSKKIDATGSCEYRFSSSNNAQTGSWLAVLNRNAKENDTFTAIATYKDASWGTCSINEICNMKCVKEPAPSSAPSLTAPFGTIFAMILGFFAL